MSNRDITKSKGTIGEVGVVVRPDTVGIGIMTMQGRFIARGGSSSAVTAPTIRSWRFVIALRRLAVQDKKCSGSDPLQVTLVPQKKHFSKGALSTGR